MTAVSFMRAQSSPGQADLPARHPLAHIVAEALICAPNFAALWADNRDPSFRPFATAVFQLANVSDLSLDERRHLATVAATEKRGKILSRLAGLAVRMGGLKIVAKAEWWRFSRRDWLSLLKAAADEDIRRALGHVPLITPRLVRQLRRIPQDLLLPRVFNILNELELPPRRWKGLAAAMGRAGGDVRLALITAAHRIDSVGAFWDFCFLCTEARLGPFDIPSSAFASTMLEPLSTTKDLKTEGQRMNNCLGKLAGQVRAGRGIFFRLRGEDLVSAELTRSPTGWVPGRVLGTENQAVPFELFAQVRAELERIAGSCAANDGLEDHLGWNDFVDGLRNRARTQFSAAEIEELAATLRLIRGRTLASNNGAYAYFEAKGGGYIQFMSSIDGNEYLCEISSHKYEQRLERLLTDRAVCTVQNAGFLWPDGKANFVRWFAVAADEDLVRLAELSLAILAKVCRHRPGRALKVGWSVPRQESCDADRPGVSDSLRP